MFDVRASFVDFSWIELEDFSESSYIIAYLNIPLHASHLSVGGGKESSYRYQGDEQILGKTVD